jgi:hypothetical protein
MLPLLNFMLDLVEMQIRLQRSRGEDIKEAPAEVKRAWEGARVVGRRTAGRRSGRTVGGRT